jgi:hypothetical protein
LSGILKKTKTSNCPKAKPYPNPDEKAVLKNQPDPIPDEETVLEKPKPDPNPVEQTKLRNHIRVLSRAVPVLC